jgi:uncharacterized Fe-S cluster protein YjdI/predicted GNAT family acetyltransferase
MNMTEQELLALGYRKYTGRDIDVFFKKEQCAKSGRCVKGSTEVFDPGRKPWILPDNETSDKVKAVIDTCPSGALMYIVKNKQIFNTFKSNENRFYLETPEGKVIAYVGYLVSGSDVLIINGTFVDPSLRGQGIGQSLIEQVIKLAIDNDKKIFPLCPFARKTMEANEGFRQLIHR